MWEGLPVRRLDGTWQNVHDALREELRLGAGAPPTPHAVGASVGSSSSRTGCGRFSVAPGTRVDVPIWLLGSSDFSATLAAELGLPFAFASHFAPDYLHAALALYRESFEPSGRLAEPYAVVGVSVFAADTDAEGRRLFTWRSGRTWRG